MKKSKSILWWSLAIIGYYCWFQTFYNAVRFGDMFPYSDFMDMLEGVVKNFIPIMILALTDLLIVFRLTAGLDIKKKICADLLLSGVVTVVIGYLYVAVRYATGHTAYFDPSIVDWAGTFLNDIIILLGVELVYYFTRLLHSQKETEAARHQSLQYQYEALKAQVNPHFLFNSLNLLYSLVAIDSDKAKSFIRELARMYRYVMARHNSRTVSVEDEFEFLKSYISVLEMRYNNKFSVIIEGTSPPNTSMIPFTMQLLIENVTKHNVISQRLPMEVRVKLEEDRIVVTNPVRRNTSGTSGSKIGLHYLSQLYALYGHRFETKEADGNFTAYVPLITDSDIALNKQINPSQT